MTDPAPLTDDDLAEVPGQYGSVATPSSSA